MAKAQRHPSETFGSFARTLELSELALTILESLRARGRPYALLTGIDRGPAGIPSIYHPQSYDGEVGAAFSFCLDGHTYTAFEDPQDGYRSSLSRIAMRRGNHCSTRFDPCACIPVLSRHVDDPAHYSNPLVDLSSLDDPGENEYADIFRLAHPLTSKSVLEVGTRRADDYYPCFVGHFDPHQLTLAQAYGLALADELDKTLPAGSRSPKNSRI